jgi:hypothetical protein
MDNENEDVLEGAEGQEENAQEEVLDVETEETPDEEVAEDENVTLTKAEFSKLNRKAKAYDATKPKKEEVKERTDLSTKAEPSNEKLERMELRLDGYSKEEVDEIMELGGTKVLGSKFVQSAIKAMRAEKKSTSADANFSAKSPVFKKYTQEDLNKMTSTELEKILPHS